MSNRNFIFLILVLIIILVTFFGFLFFGGDESPLGEDSGGTNFFSQFNPFDNSGVRPDDTDEPIDIGGDPGTLPDTRGPAIIKVSSMPVAGYAVFLKERYKEIFTQAENPVDEAAAGEAPRSPAPPQIESVPAVRYVDRVSGEIYQTFADKIEERRFSATEIPKVHEAVFGNGGSSVIMRYLKTDGRTIESLFANLPKEVLGGDTAGEIEVRGALLPLNITGVSVSPDGASAFYLFDSGETSVGTTLEFATGKRTQVFDSAFNEWLPEWPAGNMFTLTTKPSFLAGGYMYKFDTSTKSLSQVLADIPGLTTLAGPDGKTILYSDSSLALNLYDMETKISASLGLRTLPEKCAWNKDGSRIYCFAPKLVIGSDYPDAWYQGEVSFNDQLWLIIPETGTATVLLDPTTAGSGEDIDGIKLALDSGENYLFFVNKKDSFLWEARLK